MAVPPAAVAPAAYACHWEYVQGPAQNGKTVRTMMWICEYPYRTIRAKGPCDADCPGQTETKQLDNGVTG